MKILESVLMAALLATCGTACADGGGTLYHNGVAIPLASAYAYAQPDTFEPSKQIIHIVFSTAAIDAAAYDAVEDRDRAFDHTLRWANDGKVTTVTLQIGPDKDRPVEGINVVISADGKHDSTSASMGPGMYMLDLKQNDGKRIDGTFRTKDEKRRSSKDDDYFDLHFAVNVASGPAFGPGLPPDGGEPLKGYRDYLGALLFAATRDELDDDRYQKLINTLTDARIKTMNQIAKSAGKGKADQKILAELKKMWSDAPHGDNSLDETMVRFAGGRLNGDVATMEIEGPRQGTTDKKGNYTPGPTMFITVTMKKENGEWCFDKAQVHAPAAAAKK